MEGSQSNIFEAYHLASFVCHDGHAISTEDALERLRSIERTAILTPIHLLIVVDSKEIRILSREKSEDIERFSLSTICSMSYRMTGDPQDGCYKNLIFLSTPTGDLPITVQSEMHIFSCIYTPANQVIALIKQAQSGQWKPQVDPNKALNNFRLSNQQHPNAIRPGNIPARPHDPSMDRIERQYFLLNRCFDDIDRFIAQVQLAMSTMRELQQRQNQRKKNIKHSGDGLLTIRARLPAKEQFVDCFKKFKLSFNLLALLQTRLEDPSASELVHNLFRLLPIVISVCSHIPGNSPNRSGDLPSRVVSPLLSKEAILLLKHCLTFQEEALWNRLGQAWRTSKEESKDYVPNYIPTFNDGFTPDPSDLESTLNIEQQRRPNLSHKSSMQTGSHNLVEMTASLNPVNQVNQVNQRNPVNQGVRRVASSKQADNLTHELKEKLKNLPTHYSPPETLHHQPVSPPPHQINNHSPTVFNNNLRKTPKVSKIDMNSSPGTVRDWLDYKGFSLHVQEAMNEKSGDDLFEMTRSQMEGLIGVEEATRLESVLKVQKNIAGYKTMSGRELQAILQRRKLKAESKAEAENSGTESEIEMIDQLFKNIYSTSPD